MMVNFLTNIMAVVVVGLASVPFAQSENKPVQLFAQATQRVQFPKGEYSTYVTREIPADGLVDFLINARKGQTMEYTVGYDFDDVDVQSFLSEPGLQDISLSSGPKEPNTFVVKKSGDHRLTVRNMTSDKITITLYLDIR